jgi:hypothetical protein
MGEPIACPIGQELTRRVASLETARAVIEETWRRYDERDERHMELIRHVATQLESGADQQRQTSEALAVLTRHVTAQNGRVADLENANRWLMRRTLMTAIGVVGSLLGLVVVLLQG